MCDYRPNYQDSVNGEANRFITPLVTSDAKIRADTKKKKEIEQTITTTKKRNKINKRNIIWR